MANVGDVTEMIQPNELSWFIGGAMAATQCPKGALYHCVELKKKQCGSPCTAKNYKYDTMYYDLVTKTVSELLFLWNATQWIYTYFCRALVYCMIFTEILSNKTLTWCKVFK